MLFLIILSITLALDSFTACLAIGLSNSNIKKQQITILITCITIFHFIMPIIGYSISSISNINYEISKYLTGIIFFVLGLKMIFDGIKHKKNTSNEISLNRISFKIFNIIIISLSLSIDALIVGFATPLLNLDFSAVTIALFFAIFALILSMVGYYSGKLLKKLTNIYSNILAGILMLSLAIKAFLF